MIILGIIVFYIKIPILGSKFYWNLLKFTEIIKNEKFTEIEIFDLLNFSDDLKNALKLKFTT